MALPPRSSNIAFAVLFALALYFFYRIIEPFLMPVIFGAFVAVLAYPLYSALVRLSRGRRRIVAMLATSAILVLGVVPAAFLAFAVANQLLDLVGHAQRLFEGVNLDDWVRGRLGPLARLLPQRPLVSAADLQGLLLAAAQRMGTVLTGLLAVTARALVYVFLGQVAVYYFLVDGPDFLRTTGRLLPLDLRYSRELFREFQLVAYSIIYVHVLTAVVQGAVGYLGFLVVSLPHALLWATLMTVFAMLPFAGTPVVWAPIGLALLVSGKIWQGIFVLSYGLLVVGTVDNFLRPLLLKGRLTLHPLMVFLSIFGGLAAFGIMGVLLGPLIASVFMAVLRIYQRDFLGGPPGPSLPTAP